MKYENGIWKLINVEELPKKGKVIDYKNCVGLTLKYESKFNGEIYEIEIINYIKGCKDKNGKNIMSKFKVKYIYLKDTEYEEAIENIIECTQLITKANIGRIIPSLNQWTKKDDYWIGIDSKGREFKFSTNDKETEYNILHSTWNINSHGYVTTGNLNNIGQSWSIHKVVYFNCNKEESDKNFHNCIDHVNNCKSDNRIYNLALVTKADNNKNKNTNNKYGLVGLRNHGKGYNSTFSIEKYKICTKVRYDLEEAKIDNLIAQKYLKLRHNEDQFYKIEGFLEERVKEVTDNLDRQIKRNRNKIKEQKEYSYDFVEKDNLIGIKTFKKDGTPNEICWVDRDFGKIEEDKYVIRGSIYQGKGYFQIDNNRINIVVMVGKMSLQNYRKYIFHIDHINQKPNENYKDNLEIVSIKSNMMNKKGKGYTFYKQRGGGSYMVYYAYKWKYFDFYIGGLKNPYFNTKEEAIAEVKRRKEIVDKYRFRIGWQGSVEANIKALDEVIDFAEEHDLDIDSAYIVWKGLDTLENIKNYLNSIDK